MLMVVKENLLENRSPPSSVRPTQLGWSPASLTCSSLSQHQVNDNCLSTSWKWSSLSSSSQTIISDDGKQILFHPSSNALTEVIRADRPLPNSGKFYWEIYVPAVFGTSLMFGIITDQQRLTSNCAMNLIGVDQHGWGLSHQGDLWHQGCALKYLSQPMKTFQSLLIGLEFDADQRTLSYSINNQSMGIAFHSISRDRPIYPAVSSTSRHSTMILQHSCQICASLREMCLKRLKRQSISMASTIIPRHLIEQLI